MAPAARTRILAGSAALALQLALPVAVAACLGLVLLFAAGCTKADIYGTDVEDTGPDRLTVRSEVCTDDTSGDRFPVKVLLVLDQSQDMVRADPDGNRFRADHSGSIAAIVNNNLTQPHVRFGFIGATTSAITYPAAENQRFWAPADPEVAAAILEISQPFAGSLAGRDLNTMLTKAENFILTDIEEAVPGEVVRSRYIVSFLLAGPPEPAIASIASIGQRVEDMVDRIYARGVLEVRINVGLVYQGPRSVNPLPGGYGDPCWTGGAPLDCYVADATLGGACACDASVSGLPEFCQMYCGVAAGNFDECRMEGARDVYQAIAYAGGGLFVEYPCASSLRFEADIAASSVRLVKKDIIAFNRNVRLTRDGPQVDSDGDGLSDLEEIDAATPTDPRNWDTDNDGLGDRTEYRAYPRQNPVDGSDRPSTCGSVLNVSDSDTDLLWNCEEDLLQTSSSLADTDGDGMPDALEFWSGTIPTTPDDRLLDFDADGYPNALEVTNHTDPRSNDGEAGTEYAYATQVDDLGNRDVVTMARLTSLRGVVLRDTAENVIGGPSFLEWDACATVPTLSWSDASWPVGFYPFEPVPLEIPESGVYTLVARAANAQEIWAEFRITVDFMPSCAEAPAPVLERPLLKPSVRTCYGVTVSNIKLGVTQSSIRVPGGAPEAAGLNEIMLFFTQAPQTRLLSPGLTKVARVPMIFTCGDPERLIDCERSPDLFDFNVTEDLFVSSFQE